MKNGVKLILLKMEHGKLMYYKIIHIIIRLTVINSKNILFNTSFF